MVLMMVAVLMVVLLTLGELTLAHPAALTAGKDTAGGGKH